MKGFPTQCQNPPRFYSVCTLQVSELCLCALNCKRDSGKSRHELLPKLLSLQRFPGFIPYSFCGYRLFCSQAHRRGEILQSLRSAISIRSLCVWDHILPFPMLCPIPLRTFEQVYQRTLQVLLPDPIPTTAKLLRINHLLLALLPTPHSAPTKTQL